MKTVFKKLTVAFLALTLCFTAAFAGCGEDNPSGDGDGVQVLDKTAIFAAVNDVSLTDANYFSLSGKEKTSGNGSTTSSEFLFRGGIKLGADLKSFEMLELDAFSLYNEQEKRADASFYRDAKRYGQGFTQKDFKGINELQTEIKNMLADETYKLQFVLDVNAALAEIGNSDGADGDNVPDTDIPSTDIPAANLPSVDFDKINALELNALVEGLSQGIIALADVKVNGDVYTIDVLNTITQILTSVKAITMLIDSNPALTLGELYNNPAVQAIALPLFGQIKASDALNVVYAFVDAEIIKQKTGVELPEAGNLSVNDYVKKVLTDCSFVYGETKIPVGTIAVRDMFNDGSDASAEWTALTPALEEAIEKIKETVKIYKIMLTIKGGKITALAVKLKIDNSYEIATDKATTKKIEMITEVDFKLEILDKMPELIDVSKNLPEIAIDGDLSDGSDLAA